MNSFKRLAISLCGLLLIVTLKTGDLVMWNVVAADAPGVSLPLSQSSYTMNSTGTFNIAITPGVTAITGAEIHITYDVTKIDVAPIIFGSSLDNFFDLSTDGEVVILGISGANSSKKIQSPTTIATVHFTAMSAGTVNLRFTKAQFVEQGSSGVSNGSGTDASFTITADTSSQGGGSSTTPSIPPTTTPAATPPPEDPSSTTSTTTTPPDQGTPAATPVPPPPAPPSPPALPPASELTALRFSVSEGPTAEVGTTVHLIAFADYADGHSENVTSPDTHPGTRYSSSDESVARLRCGLCSTMVTHAVGQVQFTATYTEGNITKSKTTSLNVTPHPAPVAETAAPALAPAPEPPDSATSTPGQPGESDEDIIPSSAPTPTADGGNGNEEVSTGSSRHSSGNEEQDPLENPSAETPPAIPGVGGSGQPDRLSAEMTLERPAAPPPLTSATDSDEDGMSDTMEVMIGTDPLRSGQEDGAGLGMTDSTRVILGVDPAILRDKAEPRMARISNLTNGDILADLSPTIFGTVSKSATSVTLQATPADPGASSLPVTLGMITHFSTFDASQRVNSRIKYFNLTGGSTAPVLADHLEYDIKAIARFANGSTVESPVIRVFIDSAAAIATPRDVALGHVAVPSDSITAIPRSFADEDDIQGIEMTIRDSQPVLTGRTDFNSQVFAVWESVVLASGVIADSEKGSFAIKAPKHLAADESHKVTVYATRDADGKTLRSKSVTVHFRIQEQGLSPLATGAVAILLLLLTTLLWTVRRSLRRKPTSEAQPRSHIGAQNISEPSIDDAGVANS